ncbi:LuxR family transcriptional regulator [Loktanella fryxellensis]|uniref:LuxR family transcriptional regulator n=1 Tax=Loktanella fryxellensis TaxID=245187 RepID=A0A1H8A4T0_9RHOB|nr:autoinducer binding domain-containing protein [Loktanella fryxellensis]SEM65563.1 LuxR family transcriptional regulator [Loktanella fryxellensis]
MTPRTTIDGTIQQIADMSPLGIMLAMHIRASVPLMTVQTFPERWLTLYHQQSLALRDPILAWAFAAQGDAIRWSDPTLADPWNIVGLARQQGLIFGVSFAAGPVVSRSIGAVSRPDREFTDAEIATLSGHFTRLHAQTHRNRLLSPGQVAALRLIADGERQGTGAERLGISRSAFKARLANARRALQARTTAEAVQRARIAGLL